jgi:ABC-type transport system involved in multi-copper enzyme maturation permease subunit
MTAKTLSGIMNTQFLPLLHNEIAKAARRKLPYFGFLAVALLCVVTFFVSGRLSNAASANAWGYVAFSMQVVFADIGPIFIIVFSAMLLAEETGTGTIRAALAAPVHRWELYLAKATVGLIYMLALWAATLLFIVALAKIHYAFGAVGDSFGVVYSRGAATREFLFGCALSWIPLGALVMYGLFISTIIRTSGAAVAVGISTLFIIDITKHMLGLDAVIFTKYIEYSWVNLLQLAQGMDYRWRPELWKMLALSVGYALALFGIGLTIFVMEDLNH